jgi:hypothetical protein
LKIDHIAIAVEDVEKSAKDYQEAFDVKDVELVKKSVWSLLESYKDTYTNTPMILLSALADGADVLVAEVAKELGFELHVILPYEKEQYLTTISQKDKFDTLIKYAKKTIVRDCPADANGKHTHCYQELGEYIANTSNILVALWDGEEEDDKNGGTASIVKYQREYFDKSENMFDSKDGNAIHIIPTARVQNPDQALDASKIKTEYLGRLNKNDFEKNLTKFDTLNAEIQNNVKVEGDSLLQSYKKFFGAQANTNQPKYRQLMILMLSLIGFAIIFLEMMHVFNGVDEMKSWASYLIVGYFVLLGAAYYIYKQKMHTGKLQDDFIFSRGLSEAIRIQNAWNAVGLKKSVSDYYLRSEPTKLTWIRMVLKNIHYLDNSDYESETDWIDGQITYFEKEIKNREENLEKYEKSEHRFFIIGAVAVWIVAVTSILEFVHWIPHWHFPFNWHFVVLISGVALLFAGFTKKILFIQGYEEEKSSFEEILPSFEKAVELLAVGDAEQKKRVVFDLGKKDLMENSQWVGLHDARRAKFEME